MSTVLITGASGGLGRALAQVGDHGGHSLLLSSRQAKPEWFDKLLGTNRAWVLPKDVVDMAARMGVDVLINNAAVYGAAHFSDLDGRFFDQVLQTTLVDPIRLTHAVWPLLVKSPSGVVIQINSTSGEYGGDGETAYSAAKHGLSGFSRSLQFDGTRDGVRITNVLLGAMKTGMSKGRVNWNKFIDPYDAARVIFGLVDQPKSLRVTEITIQRSHY